MCVQEKKCVDIYECILLENKYNLFKRWKLEFNNWNSNANEYKNIVEIMHVRALSLELNEYFVNVIHFCFDL